jgi:hypothetical protein
LWGGCESGVRDTIFVAKDGSIVPLLQNFARRMPLCEAGDVVLNLRIQALTKLEDNVGPLEVTGIVHNLLETVDILIDSA